MRETGGRLRKKKAQEMEDGRIHREEVMKACDDWTMKKARKNFYGDENDVQGRNPWRDEVSKTMFWM